MAALGVLAVIVAACAPPADPEFDRSEELRRDERRGENPYRRLWRRPGLRFPPTTVAPTPTTPPPVPPTAPVPPPVPPTAPVPPPASSRAPLGPVGSFRMLFADEFEGNRLGPAWYPNRWFATNCAAGAGSPEEQFYTSRPQNVSVGGGVLHLVAQRENYTCNEWGGTKRYTSGWVQTGGSRDIGGVNAPAGFTCGIGCFVEARVKMPAGGMTFPAVWMLPVRRSQSDPDARYPARPEIDIVEFWDGWSSWEHHLHSVCGSGNVDIGRTHRGPDASGGFHTVGLWWRSPNVLEYYVDGVRTWTYTGCGVPGAGEQMYLILNHAIGHAAPSPSSTEPFPKDMQVDYVRAWTS